MNNYSIAQLEHCHDWSAVMPYCGPRGCSCTFYDTKTRYVGDKSYSRNLTETFDDFVMWHFVQMVGKQFWANEERLQPQYRHAISTWFAAMRQVRHQHVRAQAGGSEEVMSTFPTGYVQSLLEIADDVYRLSLVGKLTETILRRLRDRVQFQGVAYEISVAASYVRAGFDIEWLLESDVKNPEFIATHPKTAEKLVVEAKVRHRAGVLHVKESQGATVEAKADIKRLYLSALKKETNGLPLAVHCDVNMPYMPAQLGGMPTWAPDIKNWLEEVREPSEAVPAKEFLFVVTNQAAHYAKNDKAPPTQPLFVLPEWVEIRPVLEETLASIIQGVEKYGRRPEMIPWGVAMSRAGR